MNYLAHFFLADPDEPLMIGNFMGDGVKGADLKLLHQDHARGVRFHRFIDSYTDAHPEVVAARKLFQPTQGKWSGVVLDVVFDHFLAISWQEFHDQPLEKFTSQCYRLIAQHYPQLPQRSARFYDYMVSRDVLTSYAQPEGITQVLQGMDSRTKYTSAMAQTMVELARIRPDVETHFFNFFPELIVQSREWRTAH